MQNLKNEQIEEFYMAFYMIFLFVFKLYSDNNDHNLQELMIL